MSATNSASLDANSLLDGGQSSTKLGTTNSNKKSYQVATNKTLPSTNDNTMQQTSFPGQRDDLHPMAPRSCGRPRPSSYLKPIEELRAGEMATTKTTGTTDHQEQVTGSPTSSRINNNNSSGKTSCSEPKARIFSIFIGISTTIGLIVVLLAVVVDSQMAPNRQVQFEKQQAMTQIGSPLLSRNNKPTYSPQTRASQVVAAAAATIIDHPKDPLLSDAEHYRLIRDQELHYTGSGSRADVSPSSRRLARSDMDADDSDDSDQDQDQDQAHQQQQQQQQKHRQRQPPLPAPVSREQSSKRKWSQPINREQQDQIRAVARQLMEQSSNNKARPSAERRSNVPGRKSVPRPQAEATPEQDGDYDEDNPPSETKQPEVPERRKLADGHNNNNKQLPGGNEQLQGSRLASRGGGGGDGSGNFEQRSPRKESSSASPPDDSDPDGQAREELNEEANDETHFTRKPGPSSHHAPSAASKSRQSGARSPSGRQFSARAPSEQRAFNGFEQHQQSRPNKHDRQPSGGDVERAQSDDQNAPVDSLNEPTERQGDDSDDGLAPSDNGEQNHDERASSEHRRERGQQDPTGAEPDNPNYLSSEGGGDGLDEQSGNGNGDGPDESGSAFSPSSTSEVKLSKGSNGSASRLTRGRAYSQPIADMALAGKQKPAAPRPVSKKLEPVPIQPQTGAIQPVILQAVWATKLSSPKKRDSSEAYNPQNNPSHAGKYFIN